jgi:hypothetical protein
VKFGESHALYLQNGGLTDPCPLGEIRETHLSWWRGLTVELVKRQLGKPVIYFGGGEVLKHVNEDLVSGEFGEEISFGFGGFLEFERRFGCELGEVWTFISEGARD